MNKYNTLTEKEIEIWPQSVFYSISYEFSNRLSYWYQKSTWIFYKRFTDNTVGDMRFVLCLVALLLKVKL